MPAPAPSDALGVTCPQCRASAGQPCAGVTAPHRARVLAAAAVARMPAQRPEEDTHVRATKAARARQRARARDPRMNNDW